MHRWLCGSILLSALVGCGPPEALRAMHAAFNRGQWAAVTEKYADLGRPRDLDAISYARVATAAAEVYRQSKSPAYLDLALDCYSLAAARDRSLADRHHFARGQMLWLAGRQAEALAAYQEALAVNPRHLGAALETAVLLASTNRYAEAAQAAQGLLNVRRPVGSELLQGLSTLALAEAAQGKPDAAVKVLQHAANIGPGDWAPDLLYVMATCHAARNENGPARMSMRKALSLLPDGDIRQPRFTKYLETLELESRAAASNAVPAPRHDLGAPPTPASTDKPDVAAADPPPATRPAPPPAGDPAETRATELAAKAAGLASEGKPAEAIALLKEAVQLAPKLPAPAAQLAALLVRQRQYADAVQVLETAIQHNPDNVVLKQMLEKLRSALAADSQPGG